MGGIGRLKKILEECDLEIEVAKGITLKKASVHERLAQACYAFRGHLKRLAHTLPSIARFGLDH